MSQKQQGSSGAISSHHLWYEETLLLVVCSVWNVG